MMVAAGVPIRNEENAMFLRREGRGYARLRRPTAVGILAAQATPVRLDMISRTMPFGESEVVPTRALNTKRLIRRSDFRETVENLSAMCPNGSRKAPVVRLTW